jgi:hypothetical protein
MDTSGKVTVEWWNFSMYKLHQLLTIIVDNTKTSTDLVFVHPLEVALKEAKKFIDAFDAIHLRDVAMDPLAVVRIQQDAKRAFNTSNPRMHDYLLDEKNSKQIMHRLMSFLKDSPGLDAALRARNAKLFTIFVEARLVGANFPTDPIEIG